MKYRYIQTHLTLVRLFYVLRVHNQQKAGIEESNHI